MEKIAIFYGSTTGNTKNAAELIAQEFGEDNVALYDIGESSKDDFDKHNHMILGTSTWGYGELEDSWLNFEETLESINFKGKKVALFGLGDQEGFADTFQDAMGMIYEKIINNGGEVVGFWPEDGYSHTTSRAVENGNFVGLSLDDNNQSDMTPERIKAWVNQLKKEF